MELSDISLALISAGCGFIYGTILGRLLFGPLKRTPEGE